jgi:hypothetical protein
MPLAPIWPGTNGCLVDRGGEADDAERVVVEDVENVVHCETPDVAARGARGL